VSRLDPTIHYLAFFRTLGDTAEGSATWRALSAGLLVLRLIDAWLDGDPVDEAAAAAVLDAARAVDATDTARGTLVDLAETVSKVRETPSLGAVVPGLLNYIDALEIAGTYRLMSDVARCLERHARSADHTDLAITATLAIARGARLASDTDVATKAYTRASRLARAHGDHAGALGGEIGLAKLAGERGNLPEMERLLNAVLRKARAHRLEDTMAITLHELATAAHLRREHERAIRFCWEALQHVTQPRPRARILADMATAFGAMGVRAVARDTLLLGLASTTEEYSRWTSLINLMELASLDGQESAFEGYRRELEGAPLTPFIRATYLLHVGQAFARANRPDEAERALADAIGLAEQHQFNRILFAVEAARDAIARHEAAPAVVSGLSAPTSLADVVDAIAVMRRSATPA
jgi:tetratricopeptide (TPR) repeat protein